MGFRRAPQATAASVAAKEMSSVATVEASVVVVVAAAEIPMSWGGPNFRARQRFTLLFVCSSPSP
jgi:hypothetical protein